MVCLLPATNDNFLYLFFAIITGVNMVEQAQIMSASQKEASLRAQGFVQRTIPAGGVQYSVWVKGCSNVNDDTILYNFMRDNARNENALQIFAIDTSTGKIGVVKPGTFAEVERDAIRGIANRFKRGFEARQAQAAAPLAHETESHAPPAREVQASTRPTIEESQRALTAVEPAGRTVVGAIVDTAREAWRAIVPTREEHPPAEQASAAGRTAPATPVTGTARGEERATRETATGTAHMREAKGTATFSGGTLEDGTHYTLTVTYDLTRLPPETRERLQNQNDALLIGELDMPENRKAIVSFSYTFGNNPRVSYTEDSAPRAIGRMYHDFMMNIATTSEGPFYVYARNPRTGEMELIETAKLFVNVEEANNKGIDYRTASFEELVNAGVVGGFSTKSAESGRFGNWYLTSAEGHLAFLQGKDSLVISRTTL